MFPASLSSLTTGIIISWPSPFIPKIVEDKENYDITEEQASYFAAINIIGLIVLSPFFVPLVNILGRKKCILMSSIPYITTLLIKAFVTNIWGLYLARLITGFGDVLIFNCLPVYIGEISTPKVRGLWGNAFVCSIFSGQFVVNVLGTYFSVQATSFIAVTIPIALLILFPFMPESPYFYISKGKDEEAKINLRRLRRKVNVDKEFETIKTAVQKQLSDPSGWMDIFRIAINKRAFLVVTFLRCAQIFGGVMTFAAYTKYIFQNTRSSIDPSVASILYAAVNATCHTCMSLISNKLGRRKSFISSTFLCSLVLFALGIYSLLQDFYPAVPLEGMDWFPLAGMLTYLLFCSFGLGTVPTLLLGELFPSSIKNKAVALVGSMFGLAAFSVNNFFYYFATYTGLCGPFLFFAGCNFLVTIISYFVMPETKNKTLEEIQQALK